MNMSTIIKDNITFNNIGLKRAYTLLKKGYKIRRHSWVSDKYLELLELGTEKFITLHTKNMKDGIMIWIPTCSDMNVSDWEITK